MAMVHPSTHPDLTSAFDLLYRPCGYDCTSPVQEKESTDYGAYTFELNAQEVRFRVAKITPTKVGQFVTLWKRIGDGPIQPFEDSDPVDFFIVSTRKGNFFGQFVFPKSVLVKQDIVSIRGKGGKRAMRVYPPWDKTTNRQAQKTQAWQLDFFLPLSSNQPVDLNRCQFLYSQELS